MSWDHHRLIPCVDCVIILSDLLLVLTQGLPDSQRHHCMYRTLRDTLTGIYGDLDLVIVESVLHFLSSSELSFCLRFLAILRFPKWTQIVLMLWTHILFRLVAIVLFLYLPISFVSWATMLAVIGRISLWQFIAPMKQYSRCYWEDSICNTAWLFVFQGICPVGVS